MNKKLIFVLIFTMFLVGISCVSAENIGDISDLSSSDVADDVISVDDSLDDEYVSISDADDNVVSADDSLDDALSTEENEILSDSGSADVYNWTALSDEVRNDTGVDIVNIKANLTPGSQIFINRSVTIVGSDDTYIGGSSSSDIVMKQDVVSDASNDVSNENILKQDVVSDASNVVSSEDDGWTHVYVSPSGSGSNGSIDNPGDFKATLSNMTDNTVVHMLDGDYTFNVTDNSVGIKLENLNNITIMAENSGGVILKSNSNSSSCYEFSFSQVNNILIKGINFYSSTLSKYLFYFTSSDLSYRSFENCNFINFGNVESIIYSSGIYNTTFYNCNFVNNTVKEDILYLASMTSKGQMILIDNCTFDNNTAKSNIFFNYLPQNVNITNCKFNNFTPIDSTTIKYLNIHINNGETYSNKWEVVFTVSSCYFNDDNDDFEISTGAIQKLNLYLINNTVKSKKILNYIIRHGSNSQFKNANVYARINILNPDPIVVASGETSKIQYNLTLTDDMGNLISNQYVMSNKLTVFYYYDLDFYIHNTKYTAKYNAADGLYSFNYAAPIVDEPERFEVTSVKLDKFFPDLDFDELYITVKPPVNMTMDDVIDSVYGENVTVNVNISNIESGNIIYEFIKNNEVIKTVTDSFKNNVSTVTVNDLPAGDYTVNVKCEDSNHAPTTLSKSFTVNKANSTVKIDMDSVITVFDNITVQAIVPANATGNVTFRLNNNKTVNVTDDIAEVIFEGLTAGNYTIYTVYNGDDNYNPSEEANFTFSVVKLDSVLEVTHSEPVVGEDVTITIIMNEDVNDYVTVIINDKPQSELLINGTATVTIPSVIASEVYSVKVEYAGSEKYLAKSNSTSFAIFKLDTDVELSLSDIAIGEDVVIKIKLAEDINDNVTVNVDGVSDSIKLTDGYVEYTISNVTAGTHTIIVNFNGNGKYNAAFNSTSFTVDKLNPTVVAGADPIYVGDDAVITITVDSKATGSVLVGNNYYAVINDGSAKVTIPNLANGTYTYSVVYSGDEKYNKSETSVSVVVNKKATVSKVNVEDIELGQVAEITVSGLPSDATGTISIEVTGVPAQTINVGQTCSIPDLTNGTYTVNIIYSGDDRYAGSTDSKVFTVKYVEPVNETSITNITDLNTDTKDISISLPSDASGTLSVTVDGNTTIVGVVNGTANVPVNLTAGKHDVKVSYSGDGKYAGFTKESSVDVAKAAPVVVPSVPASIVAGSSISLPINLPADATGVVLVDVAGQKYYGEVTKGVANVAIAGLTAGDKTLTYNYLGDAKYAPVNGSVILKVTNPAPTPKPKADVIKLTLKKVKVKKSAKKLVISATLKINGKAVKGKKITFKFNKKTYTAKTNKKGVAKITVKKAVLKNLKVGKKVTYTAKYSKKTVKKTVKVKK